MRPTAVVLAAACVLSLHRIAAAGPPKLTLDQVIARAVAGPKVEMAEGDMDAAAARVEEAGAARLPRIKVTAYGTVSPRIECVANGSFPASLCLKTDPQNFSWEFSGFLGSLQIEVTQPLYTFGKIAHARAAARAGLSAQQALANEAAGDLAVDAARAYWGLKVARELGGMLDDGIEKINDASKRMNDPANADVSIQDRQRVAVLLATAKAQRADAGAGEAQALAALRALTGLAAVDIDDDPLEAVAATLPTTAVSTDRPQAAAAKQGAIANDELVRMARSAYFPDLALVASGVIAGAQGADDPPSVFANDPYNRRGVGAVLALAWTAEPWTTHARVAQAMGQARKAHAQSALAVVGAGYDAEVALAEATGAEAKVAAAREGEAAGHTWLVAVLQQEAVGAAESKDLADAYIAWFQMRAQWAQAVLQWNVAVVRLRRAGGEFRAAGHRPPSSP